MALFLVFALCYNFGGSVSFWAIVLIFGTGRWDLGAGLLNIAFSFGTGCCLGAGFSTFRAGLMGGMMRGMRLSGSSLSRNEHVQNGTGARLGSTSAPYPCARSTTYGHASPSTWQKVFRVIDEATKSESGG